MLSIRLVLGNLAAWTHGACIVYPSEIFDPPSIVDAVTQERCTALHGVPTHFLGVLAEVQRRRDQGETVDVRNLRYANDTASFLQTTSIANRILLCKDRHRSWISGADRAHEAAHPDGQALDPERARLQFVYSAYDE